MEKRIEISKSVFSGIYHENRLSLPMIENVGIGIGNYFGYVLDNSKSNAVFRFEILPSGKLQQCALVIIEFVQLCAFYFSVMCKLHNDKTIVAISRTALDS